MADRRSSTRGGEQSRRKDSKDVKRSEPKTIIVEREPPSPPPMRFIPPAPESSVSNVRTPGEEYVSYERDRRRDDASELLVRGPDPTPPTNIYPQDRGLERERYYDPRDRKHMYAHTPVEGYSKDGYDWVYATSLSSSVSSSGSSALLNISRYANGDKKRGVIRSFFTTPRERRRKVRRRRSGHLSRVSSANSSSSSINSDLAYGMGFLKIKKRTRRNSSGRRSVQMREREMSKYGESSSRVEEMSKYEERRDREKVRERERESDRERWKREEKDPEAAILATGAALAAMAKKQNQLDLKEAKRTGSYHGRPPTDHIGNAKLYLEKRKGKKVSYQQINEDDEWQDVDDNDSESSIDTSLAYGGSGGGKWSFGWGKPVKPGVVDPSQFGPNNSLNGIVTHPVGFDDIGSDVSGAFYDDIDTRRGTDFREETRQDTLVTRTESFDRRESSQRVYTSDTAKFDAINGSSNVPTSRPAPVPIQQPQPIAPVSKSVYAAQSEVSTVPPSTRPTSPPRSTSQSLAGAALAGFVGAGIGASVAGRREDREESFVSERREKRDKRDDLKSEISSRSRKDETREERRERKDRERREKGERRETSAERRDRKERERRERRKDREKDREETREERRERRREERRSEVSASTYGPPPPTTFPGISETQIVPAHAPIDPFQYQVEDDAFPTPLAAGSLVAERTDGGGGRTPTIVTVSRSPDFTAMERRRTELSEREREAVGESFSQVEGRSDRYDGSSAVERAEHLYEDVEHSTLPLEAGMIGAAMAAIAAEESRVSRSEKRRDERRGESSSQYEREERQRQREREIDEVQRQADLAYRQATVARRAASKVIRDRSPSPDPSVIDKYKADKGGEEEEIVRIVTPPELKEHPIKTEGLYDAPNADFKLDHEMDPHDYGVFSASVESPVPTGISRKRGFSNPRRPDEIIPIPDERPLLTLIRPTPVPTPVPQIRQPPRKEEREEQRQERREKVERDAPEPRKEPKPELPDLIIGPRGEVTYSEPGSASASTVSKAVTWGDNETKHYEVESPYETKDEFISDVPDSPEAPKVALDRKPSTTETKPPNKKPSDKKPSSGWGIIAQALSGGAAAAATTAETKSDIEKRDIETKPQVSERPKSSQSEPFEYRGVTVEPERTQSIRGKSKDSGPKVRKVPDQMPGSFGDDIDFAATVAAGLQDSGFDPNIVVDDPAFHRRSSPPGSDEGIYKGPYAETVSDLTTAQDVSLPASVPGSEVFGIDRNSATGNVEVAPVEEKESKKDRRKSREVEAFEDPASREIVEEPASYVEEPKLSKKELRKLEKAKKRHSMPIEEVAALVDIPTPTETFVEDPEAYTESPGKKKKKKSKKGAYSYDDYEDTAGSQVTVPVNAFDDLRNGGAVQPDDEWDDVPAKKKKKKSKRDSEQYDSPSRSVTTSETGTEGEKSSKRDRSLRSETDEVRFPAAIELPQSAAPSEVSRVKVQDEIEPQDAAYPAAIELPRSTVASEVGRDDESETRRSKRSSKRDSEIFEDRDVQSVVSAGDRHDDEERRKSKRRSKSRDDFDDTKSVASAPGRYDDYDDKKSSKKEKRSSGIFANLFGGRSEVKDKEREKEKDRRDDSPRSRSSRDFSEEPRRKRKSKRSSTGGDGDYFDDAASVAASEPAYEYSRSSNGTSRKKYDDDDDDDDRVTARSEVGTSTSRKRDADIKRDQSFLDNAGIRGAGAGLAGVAAALTAQHYANALHGDDHARALESGAEDSSLKADEEPASVAEEQVYIDPEIIRRRDFRPSIDPQYGDLLPMPPSDPSSPILDPVEDLPALPDSRPETPERERFLAREARDRSVHSGRKSDHYPIKSPSQSAVPLTALKFKNRSQPSSPSVARAAVAPWSSPAPPTPPSETLTTPRQRGRPTSWDSSKEYRPLFLLEQTRRDSSAAIQQVEDLPALPESGTTSRSSSHADRPDELSDSDVSFKSFHESADQPLSIDTAIAREHEHLGSEESTPRALTFYPEERDVSSVNVSRDEKEEEYPGEILEEAEKKKKKRKSRRESILPVAGAAGLGIAAAAAALAKSHADEHPEKGLDVDDDGSRAKRRTAELYIPPLEDQALETQQADDDDLDRSKARQAALESLTGSTHEDLSAQLTDLDEFVDAEMELPGEEKSREDDVALAVDSPVFATPAEEPMRELVESSAETQPKPEAVAEQIDEEVKEIDAEPEIDTTPAFTMSKSKKDKKKDKKNKKKAAMASAFEEAPESSTPTSEASKEAVDAPDLAVLPAVEPSTELPIEPIAEPSTETAQDWTAPSTGKKGKKNKKKNKNVVLDWDEPSVPEKSLVESEPKPAEDLQEQVQEPTVEDNGPAQIPVTEPIVDPVVQPETAVTEPSTDSVQPESETTSKSIEDTALQPPSTDLPGDIAVPSGEPISQTPAVEIPQDIQQPLTTGDIPAEPSSELREGLSEEPVTEISEALAKKSIVVDNDDPELGTEFAKKIVSEAPIEEVTTDTATSSTPMESATPQEVEPLEEFPIGKKSKKNKKKNKKNAASWDEPEEPIPEALSSEPLQDNATETPADIEPSKTSDTRDVAEVDALEEFAPVGKKGKKNKKKNRKSTGFEELEETPELGTPTEPIAETEAPEPVEAAPVETAREQIPSEDLPLATTENEAQSQPESVPMISEATILEQPTVENESMVEEFQPAPVGKKGKKNKKSRKAFTAWEEEPADSGTTTPLDIGTESPNVEVPEPITKETSPAIVETDVPENAFTPVLGEPSGTQAEDSSSVTQIETEHDPSELRDVIEEGLGPQESIPEPAEAQEISARDSAPQEETSKVLQPEQLGKELQAEPLTEEIIAEQPSSHDISPEFFEDSAQKETAVEIAPEPEPEYITPSKKGKKKKNRKNTISWDEPEAAQIEPVLEPTQLPETRESSTDEPVAIAGEKQAARDEPQEASFEPAPTGKKGKKKKKGKNVISWDDVETAPENALESAKAEQEPAVVTAEVPSVTETQELSIAGDPPQKSSTVEEIDLPAESAVDSLLEKSVQELEPSVETVDEAPIEKQADPTPEYLDVTEETASSRKPIPEPVEEDIGIDVSDDFTPATKKGKKKKKGKASISWDNVELSEPSTPAEPALPVELAPTETISDSPTLTTELPILEESVPVGKGKKGKKKKGKAAFNWDEIEESTAQPTVDALAESTTEQTSEIPADESRTGDVVTKAQTEPQLESEAVAADTALKSQEPQSSLSWDEIEQLTTTPAPQSAAGHVSEILAEVPLGEEKAASESLDQAEQPAAIIEGQPSEIVAESSIIEKETPSEIIPEEVPETILEVVPESELAPQEFITTGKKSKKKKKGKALLSWDEPEPSTPETVPGTPAEEVAVSEEVQPVEDLTPVGKKGKKDKKKKRNNFIAWDEPQPEEPESQQVPESQPEGTAEQTRDIAFDDQMAEAKAKATTAGEEPNIENEVILDDSSLDIAPAQEKGKIPIDWDQLDEAAIQTPPAEPASEETIKEQISDLPIVDSAPEPETVEEQEASTFFEPAPTGKKGKKKKGKSATIVWDEPEPASEPIPEPTVDSDVAEFVMPGKKSEKKNKKSKSLQWEAEDEPAVEGEGALKEVIESASGTSEQQALTSTIPSETEAFEDVKGLPETSEEASPIPAVSEMSIIPKSREAEITSGDLQEPAAAVENRYNEEQMDLAKQLQEEFGRGSKKSKKDKKKRQSLLSQVISSDDIPEEQTAATPEEESATFLEPSEEPRERSVSSERRQFDVDQMDLARQLQAEFASGNSKRSKKDKKKRQGLTRTMSEDDSSVPETPDVEVSDATTPREAESSVEDQSHIDRDGLEAGFKEDQLELARQLQAEFGSKSKKKDKKRRSTSQTPTQEKDFYFDQPLQDEPQAFEQSQPPTEITESATEEFQASSPAPGYTEDQLELARQLKEEFTTGSSRKKSKKEKRQSLLRSTTEDDFSMDSGVDDGTHTPGSSKDVGAEQVSTTVDETITADPEDEWATTTKKSKKDKKKKKRLSTFEDLPNESISPSREPAITDKTVAELTAEDGAQPELIHTPADDDHLAESLKEDKRKPQFELADLAMDSGFVMKKSKKDKKKKKQNDLDALLAADELEEKVSDAEPLPETDEPKTELSAGNETIEQPIEQAVPSIDTLSREPTAVQAFDESRIMEPTLSTESTMVEPEEEAPLSKKSKKEKKKRQSALAAVLEAEALESKDSSNEESIAETTTPAEEATVKAVEAEDFWAPTKKSKKDKKKSKRKDSGQVDLDDDPTTVTPAEDVTLTNEALEDQRATEHETPQPLDASESGHNVVSENLTREVQTQPINKGISAEEPVETQPDTGVVDTKAGVDKGSADPIEDYFGFTKKSKKDKKKKGKAQPQFESPNDFFTPTEAAVETDTPTDNVTPVGEQAENTPVDDFEFMTPKKSKKKNKAKEVLTPEQLETPMETPMDFYTPTEPTAEQVFEVVPDVAVEPTLETVPEEPIGEEAPDAKEGEELAAIVPGKESTGEHITEESKEEVFAPSSPRELEKPIDITAIEEPASVSPNVVEFAERNLAEEANPDDSAFITKRSKKDKKKKGKGLSSSTSAENSGIVTPAEPAQLPTPPTVAEQIEIDPENEISITEPPTEIVEAGAVDADEYFAPVSRKQSKKDKKKKKAQAVLDEPSVETANTDRELASVPSAPEAEDKAIEDTPTADAAAQEILAEAKREEENEKPEEPLEEEPATEIPAQPFEPLVVDIPEVPPKAEPEDSYFVTKRSKKDKKRKNVSRTDTLETSTPIATSVTQEITPIPESSELQEQIEKGLQVSTIGDESSAFTLKPSKKDKKKRKLMGNLPAPEETAVSSPASWADEVMEADDANTFSTEPQEIEEHGKDVKEIEEMTSTGSSKFKDLAEVASATTIKSEVSSEPPKTPNKSPTKGSPASFPKKKAKKGKKSTIVDRRSNTEDDLFDDPVLWEGADPQAHREEKNPNEAKDDFWDTPVKKPTEETPVKVDRDIAVEPVVEVRNTEIPRLEPPQDFSTTQRPQNSLAPAAALSPSWSFENLEESVQEPSSEIKGKEVAKAPEQEAMEVSRDFSSTPTRDLARTPEKADRPFTPETLKKSPTPSPKHNWGALAELPAVKEEESPIDNVLEKAQDVQDVNRDSGVITGSPIPAHATLLPRESAQRDSGIHLRTPERTSLVSATDEAIARLSWPSVNEDAETVDLNKSMRALPESKPADKNSKAKRAPLVDEHEKERGSKVKDLSRRFEGVGGLPAPQDEKGRQTPLWERRVRSGEQIGEARPSSAQSQRSISISRLQTPDPAKFRSSSAASNRSSGTHSSVTPSLRRSDRKISGDLRSLSQRSETNLTQTAQDRSPATSQLSSTPVANEGRARVKEMADVYEAVGEGRLGSPRSPTRPHSMRRRQSMQVLELESRLEQLAAENRALAEAKAEAENSLSISQRAAATLAEREDEIDSLKQTLDWLHKEVNRLTEVNEGLQSAGVTLGKQHNDRYTALESQHNDTVRELGLLHSAHSKITAGIDGKVQAEVAKAVRDKDQEISALRAELTAAKEQIDQLKRQILASKANDSEFLTVRDEDYFEHACQKLCQHVQQWVVRFSKFSDMRACRLTSEINNDKIIDRLDNAILDGSDVDSYLADRVKRRDVFMSITMSMVWEFIFTRYLFGMDREQRQKLKSLEKLLADVGPQGAVHQWRATTLTLLSKREAFTQQREQDTQAVVQEIISTLSRILPPPDQYEDPLQEQLYRVVKYAVKLSIEMRTQRPEYMMLPPLQPEYDANGDLSRKVTFNAGLMNERSGDTVSNEDLEEQGAIVRIVLFPLVVKRGDDNGEGDEEIVVCPAQVLVAKPKKTVRMLDPETQSMGMQSRMSMQSMTSGAADPQDMGENVI